MDNNQDRRTVRLLTITRFWHFGKHIYRLLSTRLSEPIPLRYVGWTMGVVIPLWIVLGFLGIGFHSWGLTWHFVVPFAVVVWATRSLGGGQRPFDVVRSWVKLGGRLVGLRVVLAGPLVVAYGLVSLVHLNLLRVSLSVLVLYLIRPRPRPDLSLPARMKPMARTTP